MNTVMRELEEFVKTIGTARDRKDTGDVASVPQPTAPERREATTISTCQWSIRGDQIYAPTTATTANLPAGVYRVATDMHGNLLFAKGKIITDHLLHLPDTAGERLLASIQHFWESKPKFEAKGYLYKRGVLLYGPAGGGKTVTIMFLVEDLIAKGGIVVLCEEPILTASGLAILRGIEPERPLICIIEDLDEKIQTYAERHFLALLDGENQVGNCVNIATCHTPDTRFLTTDLQWVPCGELQVGDELWAFDEGRPTGRGARRRYRRSVVLESRLACKECVRLLLDTGESFICTTDHPWLSSGAGQLKLPDGTYPWLGWTLATDLIKRPHLVRPFIPWETEQSWEAGWLAGMLDGEGSIPRRIGHGGPSNVSVAQNVGSTANRLAEAILCRTDAHVYLRKGRHEKQMIVDTKGGLASALRLIGQVRAERLIARVDLTGGMMLNKFPASVVEVEAIGTREIQSIQTTTGTYIAEGFAVHNTNFPERLNVRMINRPSRFDEVIKIGMPSEAARRCYLQHRLTPAETDLYDLDKWVRETDEFSIAHLRELVVAVCCLDRPYEETIERLKLMMTHRVSSRDDNPSPTTGGYA